MSDTNKRDIKRRARELLGQKLAHIDAVTAAVAAERTAGEAVEDAKRRQAAAREATNAALAEAMDAGWTPADLRAMGFEVAAGRLRKPKPTPHQTQTPPPPAPTLVHTAAPTASSAPDPDPRVGSHHTREGAVR